MIQKLKTAGLGFYVRETETQQKLGIHNCTQAPKFFCLLVYTDYRKNPTSPASVPSA